MAALQGKAGKGRAGSRKDKEGWHLTRPSFLRLLLDAHLFLDHYSSLANTALMEVEVFLSQFVPFMLARETKLV